jgi:predicted nucleic acid-binding protein
MVTSSGFADPLPDLVADASAVINLLASGVARPILESLPVRLRVVKEVSTELASGQRRGWNSAERLQSLVDVGLVEIVELGEPSQECFESLVVGAAVDTLDDGEAATIAYASAAGAAALIDERKARRICAARFPTLGIYTTFALLTSAHVTTLLGTVVSSDAVFNALNAGRMRVPAEDHLRVVAIIGAERARLCLSLPEYVRNPKQKRMG